MVHVGVCRGKQILKCREKIKFRVAPLNGVYCTSRSTAQSTYCGGQIFFLLQCQVLCMEKAVVA